MSEAVADSSALLALLQAEQGWQVVENYLPGLTVSTVNLSEVVAKLAESDMPEDKIGGLLRGLSLRVIPFDEAQAIRAGMLRPVSRPYGLSLGDRVCVALGLILGLPIVTADRSWKSLQVGDIRLIR